MGKNLKGKELGIGFTQRKDGLFQARFTYDGKQYCFYDKKIKDLREKVEQEKDNLKNGLKGSMKKVTLNELFNQFYQLTIIPQSRSNTIKSVKLDYDRSSSVVGNMYVVDVKTTHLQLAMNELVSKTYKPSTIIRSFKVLRRVFDYAMDNDIILKNPCNSVILPKNNKPKQRVMTIEEQNIFVDAVQNDFYRNLFMFLLSTGVRIGEACALTWDCVDFKKGIIKIDKTLISGSAIAGSVEINEPKTITSFRDIPMTDSTKQYLKKQSKDQKELRLKVGSNWRGKDKFDNLVFTTRYGSPIIHKVIETHINNIVKSINYSEIIQAKEEKREPNIFEPLSPHAFRRTFATRCFEQGLKPKNVQQILGHSSLQTTMDIYVKVIGDELKTDLEKYDLHPKCVNIV